MEPKEEGLTYFRMLVFLAYREIGSLTPKTHPIVAAKAPLGIPYFKGERKTQALDLFHKVESADSPAAVLAPFELRTGLQLEDLRQAYGEGRWPERYHHFTAGGPRWAAIADLAITLRDVIEKEDWEALPDLAFTIKRVKDNRGLLLDTFDLALRGK